MSRSTKGECVEEMVDKGGGIRREEVLHHTLSNARLNNLLQINQAPGTFVQHEGFSSHLQKAKSPFRDRKQPLDISRHSHHAHSPYVAQRQCVPSANSPASKGPLVALMAGCWPGTAVAIAPGGGSTTDVVAAGAVSGAFMTLSSGPTIVLPVSGSTAAALVVGKGVDVDLAAGGSVLVGPAALFTSPLSGSAVVLENLGSAGSFGRGSNVAFWWDGGGLVSAATSLAAWGACAGVGGGGRSS